MAYAQENSPFPPAEIVNDEGGAVVVSGEVTYTNSFFTTGVAAPMVILEDQAGFVDRNENFVLPPESQTLGQITSDFYTSPFSSPLRCRSSHRLPCAMSTTMVRAISVS